MICEKTGFHAFVEPYQMYICGDAFVFEPSFTRSGRPYSAVDLAYDDISCNELRLFRVCAQGREPLRKTLHYRIHRVDQWFDMERVAQGFNSTLLSSRTTYLSYEGEPL